MKPKKKDKIVIIPHKHSCGKSYINTETGMSEIDCGDDLGGNNNEFYQCPECRDKDFQEYWKEQGIQSERKRVCEIIDKWWEQFTFHKSDYIHFKKINDGDIGELKALLEKEMTK